MFTKFASMEVLEVKSAATRQRTASLSKFADYNDYRTEDGYVYVRVRAISSRVNKNNDGWPAQELKKSYRTFIGKPIFVDHHNTDPKKARGVIVDAAVHVEDARTSSLDPYYATAPAEHLPATWIELLLEVDAKRFPKLAKAIINGDIDGVSMGANVELSKCSHCGNEARSPEQYCKHVQSKGAYFDYVDATGQKTSKKAYEDCYDIGFFEISFVFDPADETALVSDIKHTAKAQRIAAIRAEADRQPAPQSDMTMAPEQVNTLRQEQICPICGSDMEDGVCEVCNYEEPPEGFDNPDLTKAKDEDQKMRQQDAEQAVDSEAANGPPGAQPQPGAGPTPPPPGASPMSPSTSKTTGTSTVSSEKTSAQTGRINTQERPILPATRQLSDKPIGAKTVSEAKKPVESKNQKDKMSDKTQKTADGATAQGEGVQAEKRVDVEGVGAVTGDPLSGIDHENVEKDTGDFVAPHTDTWSGGEGDSLGQQDAVTSDTGDFFTVSSEKTAADAEDNAGDEAGSTGGAQAGGSTWDSSDSGFPDHDPSRVDVAAPLKEEVGPGTSTDSSEEFRSLKHTEPVTGDSANDVGGPIGTAIASAKSQMLKAMKVAETEVALGITDADAKFERIAALENASEEVLDAQLETLSKVKTAGLKKAAPAQQKTAGRVPSFKPVTAGFDIEAHSTSDINVEDSIY